MPLQDTLRDAVCLNMYFYINENKKKNKKKEQKNGLN